MKTYQLYYEKELLLDTDTAELVLDRILSMRDNKGSDLNSFTIYRNGKKLKVKRT